MENEKNQYDFYLNEGFKKNPKEYFKLIERHARIDRELSQESRCSWLDIGCETGSFLYYLRKLYPNMCLTGMDVAQELLDHVNDGIEGERITPFLGDVTDKNKLPSDTYDIVSMTGVLQIFDDYEMILDNALSLLKNKGMFYMISLFNPEPYDVFVKYKRSGDAMDKLESGWNMFSLETMESYCKKNNYSFDAIPFEIGIDIPKKESDTIRSWTIKTLDGKRMIVNGLQLINNIYLVKIGK